MTCTGRLGGVPRTATLRWRQATPIDDGRGHALPVWPMDQPTDQRAAMPDAASMSFADMTETERCDALINARRTFRDAFATYVDEFLGETAQRIERGEITTHDDLGRAFLQAVHRAPYDGLASMMGVMLANDVSGTELTRVLGIPDAGVVNVSRFEYDALATQLVRQTLRLRAARDVLPHHPLAAAAERASPRVPDPAPTSPKPTARPQP